MNLPHNFKVYDRKEKKWMPPTFEAWKGDLFEWCLSGNGKLFARTMQGAKHASCFDEDYQHRYMVCHSTGLKDKKGNEIFEGSKLAYETNGTVIGYVVFSNGSFDLICTGVEDWVEELFEKVARGYDEDESKFYDTVVVGHIWEEE